MEWTTILAAVLTLPFVLFPVGYVWYLTAGGAYRTLFRGRVMELSCSVDTDCPPGHICIGGICVLATEH